MKGHLLGSLEEKIMDCFWREGQLSVSDLKKHLASENLAYTTLATVVSRLMNKGLLSRKKFGRGYIYSPKQTRLEFLSGRSRRVVRTLLGNFGDLAIAGFVEELRRDPKALARLKELTND